LGRITVICASCGREVHGGKGVECMGCLHQFHSSCLLRARKQTKDGRRRGMSYYICRKCKEKNPGGRFVKNEEGDVI